MTYELEQKQLHGYLSKHPLAAGAFLTALREGRVNGPVYFGGPRCGCLRFHTAEAEGVEHKSWPPYLPETEDLERFLGSVGEDETPSNNEHAALLEQWVLDWQNKQAIPAPDIFTAVSVREFSE